MFVVGSDGKDEDRDRIQMEWGEEERVYIDKSEGTRYNFSSWGLPSSTV